MSYQCALKKLIKIGEFLCSCFDVVDGRLYATFSSYYALLFSISQQTPSTGENVEKEEPFCTARGNIDWCCHCGKQYGDNSKS